MAYDAGLKVGVEGNAEFKNAVRDINDELKTMDSALRLVESTYKGQMNSMEALTAKEKALQDVYDKQKEKVQALESALKNAQEAKARYAKQADEVRAKLDAASSEMERLKNSTGDTTEEQKKLAAEMEDLNKQLKASEQGQSAATKSTNDWQRQLNDANVKLNNLDNELKQNDKYLDEAKKSADQCATSIDKMGKETKETAAEMDKATDSGTKLGTIFKGAFFANIAAQAIKTVVGKIKEFAKAAIDAGDKFGTLAEQTGLTSDRIQELEYAGIRLDVSLETMTKSMARNIKSMKAAQDGTKLSVEAYEALGVSVMNSDGSLRDSRIVYGEVIDALGRMTNETERDALAMQILGKSAMELNPLIKAGSERLKELSEEAHKAGAVMSEKAVNALDDLGETLEQTKMRAVAFVGEVIGAFLSVETAAGKMDEMLSGMADADKTQELINKYRELSRELKNTALSEEDASAKTEELNTVKQQLIDISGGVVNQLGEETGTLDEQVETLERLNKSQKALYQQQLLSLILANTGEAADKRRSDAMRESQKLYEEYIDAIDRANAIEASGGLTKFFDSLRLFDPMLKSAGENMFALKSATEEASAAIEQMDADTAAAHDAIRTLADNFGYTAEQLIAMGINANDVNAALAGMNETTVAATETMSAFEQHQQLQQETALALKDKIIALGEEISALQADYNAAYAAAKESLDGTVGLWAEMDTKAKTTVEEVEAALQSQIDWLASYNKNLSDLAGRKIPGVDTTELIKSLADGSTESAGILAGLAEASDEEVAAIVENLGKVEEGKNDLSAIMAEIQTDFDKRMTELEKRAEMAVKEMDNAAEAGDAARATMNGYIEATRDMMSTLETTYREAARRANNAYNSTLQIRSPSRKAMWSAEMYWTGIIEQTKRMQPDIEKVYAETAMKAAKAASMLFSPTMTSSHSMTIGVNSTIYMDSEIIAIATGRTQSRKNAGAARAYGV